MRYYEGPFLRTSEAEDKAATYTPPYRSMLDRRGYGATTIVHATPDKDPRSALKPDWSSPLAEQVAPLPAQHHEILRTPTLQAASQTLDPLRRSLPIPYSRKSSFSHELDSMAHTSFSSTSTAHLQAQLQPPKLPAQRAPSPARILLPSEIIPVHPSRRLPNPPRIAKPSLAVTTHSPPVLQVQAPTPGPLFRYTGAAPVLPHPRTTSRASWRSSAFYGRTEEPVRPPQPRRSAWATVYEDATR